MTDFGGLSVKEMSQAIKDALLDPGVVRTSPASLTNVLATINDVLTLGGGGGGAGGALASATAEKTDGEVSNATAVFALVPGTLINFTIPVGQSVLFMGFATARVDPGDVITSAILGVRIDGVTDFTGTMHRDTPIPHGSNVYGPVTIAVPAILAAGVHTAQLIFKEAVGSDNSARLVSNPTNPTRLSALWGTGLPTQSADLVHKEQIEVGGAFTISSVGVFVDVTGTPFAIILDEPRVVQIIAQGTIENPGAASTDSILGIKVDATEYSLGRWQLDAAIHRDTFQIVKTLLLPAGAHTISLIAKKNGGASDATIASVAATPTIVTAIYTLPVFGVGAITKQDALSITPLALSGVLTPIPGTAIAFFLPSEQVVSFDGFATFFNGSFLPITNCELALRVDGVDYPGSGCSVASLGDTEMAVASRALLLSAGPHTAELVAKVASGSGGVVKGTAATPSYLKAIYTDPRQFGVFARMATKVRTLGVFTFATGGAFIDSPGSDDDPFGTFEITVDTGGGDVLIELCAHGGAHNAGNPACIGSGLKIDGVEQSGGGTHYGVGHAVGTEIGLGGVSSQGCGQNYACGNTGYLFLRSLPAGTHTFRLTVGSAGFAGGLGYMSSNAEAPTRMIVWYN